MPYHPRHARTRTRGRFGCLLGAVAVSGLGDGFAAVAVPLLAAQLTSSPVLVAATVIAQQLPWLVVALPAGAVVDRVDRRRLLVLTDLGRAATVAVLAAAVAAEVATLPLVWVAAFALGSLDTLATGAAFAVLPRLVPGHRLGRANGELLAAETATTNLIGPALAGALFVAAPALPFAADAASFVISAALLALAVPRSPFVARTEPSSIRAEIVDGLRWFGRHHGLRLLAAGVAAFAFLGAAATATFVLFARDRLGLSEAAFGVVLALGATGFVAGGVVGGRLHDRLPPGPLVATAGAVAGAAYLVVGSTTVAWVATLALAVEGFSISTANTATLALRQRLVPSELLGRVGNAFRVLVVGMVPLGALAGGALAAVDLRLPWLVAGVAQVTVAAALAVPLRQRLGSRPPALAPAPGPVSAP